jgi:hypothetical protein
MPEDPDKAPDILKSLRKDFKLINSLLKEAEERQDTARAAKFLIRWQAFRTRLLAAEERYATARRARLASRTSNDDYKAWLKSHSESNPQAYKNRRGAADRSYNGGFSE